LSGGSGPDGIETVVVTESEMMTVDSIKAMVELSSEGGVPGATEMVVEKGSEVMEGSTKPTDELELSPGIGPPGTDTVLLGAGLGPFGSTGTEAVVPGTTTDEEGIVSSGGTDDGIEGGSGIDDDGIEGGSGGIDDDGIEGGTDEGLEGVSGGIEEGITTGG
jgi:hypothetical protein